MIRRNFAPKISSVVRRSALADLPAWYRTTTVAGADWLLNVLASRHGDIGFLDQIMATHRVHGGGVSVLHGPTRMASDKLSAIPLLRDYLPRNEADFAYLERQLVWKMRTARLSPRAFTVLKRLNELARPRPV